MDRDSFGRLELRINANTKAVRKQVLFLEQKRGKK